MTDAEGFATLEPRAWLDNVVWALLLLVSVVPFALPLLVPAQWFFAATIAATGLALWFWQKRTRACALLLSRDAKRLRARTSTGAWLDVIRIDAGAIGPALICGRLVTDSGRTLTLFLPRAAVPSTLHRALCRTLLTSRLPGSLRSQSSRERGT